MAEHHKLKAKVLTPEGAVFEGELERLSTRSVVGELGILASHAPLLGRLVPHELRLVHDEGNVERYAAAEGWIEVFANQATVLVGEATPPDQLDTSALQERLRDAEQRISESEEGTAARDRAEQEKLRAETFLQIASEA